MHESYVECLAFFNHFNTLWKHDLLPVWHAGLSESTMYSKASESQSTRISCTGCTFPDSSPFIHNLLRDVLQNHALPVLTVLASASLLAYASIRISFVFLSCTMTGKSPFRLSKLMSFKDLTLLLLFVFICMRHLFNIYYMIIFVARWK